MLKTFLELYITFFKIGAVTFGGGYAMLPILERELVGNKHWTTVDDLLDYYAVSQVTPGVIAVNVASFVGFKQKGVFGSFSATLGLITPSLIIISIIAEFISGFESVIWVQKAMSGINVAVTALLTYAVYNFTKKAIKKWWSVIFYIVSFCAIFFLKVPSVIVIVVSATSGVVIGLLSKKHSKKEEING